MTFMQEPPEGHPAWDEGPRVNGHDRVEEPVRVYNDFADYIRSFAPPDYLIDGILITGRVYALTAMTGHHKTSWATYAALAVSCGDPIGSVPVKRGRVLYLSGENDEDQKARVLANASEFGLAPEHGYFTVLSGADAIGILKDEIPRETTSLGKIDLVIVDTSIAYFGGGDENGNIDMKRHASMFRDLSVNLGGATVLILCHPVKGASRDNLLPRGGGAFLNEIDGNLTLWRAGERVTLHWQGKFRGPNFEPLEYQQKLVTLAGYKDSKGREIASVVIKPMSEVEIVRAAQAEWADENKVLYDLLHHPQHSMADIADCLGWKLANGEPYKSKVQRVMNELAVDKLVALERKKWVLTATGKKVAEKIF